MKIALKTVVIFLTFVGTSWIFFTFVFSFSDSNTYDTPSFLTSPNGQLVAAKISYTPAGPVPGCFEYISVLPVEIHTKEAFLRDKKYKIYSGECVPKTLSWLNNEQLQLVIHLSKMISKDSGHTIWSKSIPEKNDTLSLNILFQD